MVPIGESFHFLCGVVTSTRLRLWAEHLERPGMRPEPASASISSPSTLSMVLLIAPSSYHRLRFRDDDKEQLIRASNRLAIAGTAALALAILCVVYLITAYVFDMWAGLATVVFCSAAFGGFWYVLPMARRPAPRRRHPRRPACGRTPILTTGPRSS